MPFLKDFVKMLKFKYGMIRRSNIIGVLVVIFICNCILDKVN